MKIISSVVVLLFMLAAPSFADGKDNKQPTQQQDQQQQQNQGQGQKQGQSMNGSGNSTVAVSPTTTSTSASTSSSTANGNGVGANDTSIDYKEVIPRQTASAFAPPQFPTATCMKEYGGAGQGLLAGGALGFGRVDHDCSAIRLAAAFVDMGNYSAAAKVLCSTKDAKRAGLTMDECKDFIRPAFEPPAAVTAPAPQPIVVTPSITVNVPPAQVIAGVPADGDWKLVPPTKPAPNVKPVVPQGNRRKVCRVPCPDATPKDGSK